MSQYEIFSTSFNSSVTEPAMRAFWEENQFYVSKPNPHKKPFTIVMPPPNVTGDLTMGHMMYTLQDILIRWHRALGKEACYIPGTDHASIATEAKVTKMLADKGISKREIGREAFLKHAFDWKKEYGGRIIESLKTLGISCDWSRNTFTMDEKYSKSVIKAIVKLYNDGLVYKSKKLVNWCPASQSVISDEEVNTEERNGSLWHIRYVLAENPSEYIIVATTRPETLFGDLAVAVNAHDERYKHLIGKQVIVPVCNRQIPIIADHYVESEFGTGAVKITPAHDLNDFEVGKRHKLGLLNIMHPNASLNENVPSHYVGLDRFVARKKLVEELEQLKLLDKITPHKLNIGISERGNVPIEYYLSDQWYIKMDKLAELTLAATRENKLTLVPAHQEKVWEHWLTNIHDWCISRQLWWGHRLPMYTCSACAHIHCTEEPPFHCEKCNHKELKQDEDVLDTWASSWIWPFGVHAWANPTEQETKDLAYYYPTDVLVTGADIIFFWVARMVMAGEYFLNKTPFHTCYFTPIIRDATGRKMSKSLGNSPDVIGIMKKYGTDALRFSLVNQVAPGQDIFWKDESCELGKTFANKVWNAARFLTMNLGGFKIEKNEFSFDCLIKEMENKFVKTKNDPVLTWIISEFLRLAQNCRHHIDNFEFSQLTSQIYEFTWKVFCDWFVELIKPRLMVKDELAKQTLVTAFQVFDGLLRLLHPIMPFMTEKIWQEIFVCSSAPATIGFAVLPERLFGDGLQLIDPTIIKSMKLVQNVVSSVRTIRGKFNIHPGQELIVYLSQSENNFGNLTNQLETLAKAKVHFATAKQGFCAASFIPENAADFTQGCEVFVSLEGLVDKQAEKERLAKKIEKIQAVIVGIEKKLLNEQFVQGAPKHILEGAKEQLKQNTQEVEILKAAIEELLH